MYQVNCLCFLPSECFSFTYNKIIVTVLFSFAHREYLIKKDSRTSELYITVFFIVLYSWFSLSFRLLLTLVLLLVSFS